MTSPKNLGQCYLHISSESAFLTCQIRSLVPTFSNLPLLKTFLHAGHLAADYTCHFVNQSVLKANVSILQPKITQVEGKQFVSTNKARQWKDRSKW